MINLKQTVPGIRYRNSQKSKMSGLNLRLLDKNINQKYQLLAKIGSGGMGDVFLGIQRGAVDFNRLVVIKRIHDRQDEYTEEYAKMFLKEASVVASLNHPHIVKIYDFCMTGPTACIVMEYIEGETLRYIFSSCQKNNLRIPIGLTCRLILDACDALEYAHSSTSLIGASRKVIHRDIGLHNLMLDSNGYLKVIDFGIAKSDLDSDKTVPGLIKGNPAYMAPDLFTQRDPDHRIDIYGLGLCLYELLTGTRAFQFNDQATVGHIVREVCNRKLLPPSSIAPDLPHDLEKVVLKSIEKDRDKRYPTIDMFARDLKEAAKPHLQVGPEPKSWFVGNFTNRLQERRDFGAKMTEIAHDVSFAQNDSDGLLAKFQSQLLNMNSMTPTPPPPAKRYGATPPSPSQEKYNRYRLARFVIVTLLFVLGITLVFVILNKQKTSKKAAVVLTDNLVVTCDPADSTLFIDGKELGVVGADAVSFYVEPNEKHEIVLRKAGFRSYSLPFIGPASGQKRIDATLKAIDAVVVESKAPEPSMLHDYSDPVQPTPPPKRRFFKNRKQPVKKYKAAPPVHTKAPKVEKKESANPSRPSESPRSVPLLDDKKRAIPLVDEVKSSAPSSKNAVPLL